MELLFYIFMLVELMSRGHMTSSRTKKDVKMACYVWTGAEMEYFITFEGQWREKNRYKHS